MQLLLFIVLASLSSTLSSAANEVDGFHHVKSLRLSAPSFSRGSSRESPRRNEADDRRPEISNIPRLTLDISTPLNDSREREEVIEHVRKLVELEIGQSNIPVEDLKVPVEIEESIGTLQSPHSPESQEFRGEATTSEEKISIETVEGERDEAKEEIRERNKKKKKGEEENSRPRVDERNFEEFTELSRNGGVENNLSSNREDIVPRREQSVPPKRDREDFTKFVKISLPAEKHSRDEEGKQEGDEYDEIRGGGSLNGTVRDGEANAKKAGLTKIERDNMESKTSVENWEGPKEEDLIEAENFGLRAMHELYYVKEPKLYSMGLYLNADDPARFVAAFNGQTDEARILAKFGYAALEGAMRLSKKFPESSGELVLLPRNTRRTSLQRQCPRRGTPRCPPASLRYRTSDGSCNNLQNLWWGSAMSTFQRFMPPVYQDGLQSVRRARNGGPLPSAREISNILHEDRDVSLASVTHMLMQWGQFVDHDITATGQSRGFNGTVPRCCLDAGAGFQPPEFLHPECLPIAVSPRDSFFGPLGVRCLEFLRSGPAPREGCEFGPREQLTQVTSYLDASTVYSSNALQSDSLRIFRNGLLQYGRIQSRRPVLPRQDSDLCRRGSLSTSCFRAGDGRLGEQPALTSIHVVFLRLHNRIATQLAALNSHWSDEKLFQETRRIVGAVVQHITYREYLPIVLGPRVMKIFNLEVLRKGYYDGYDISVNPTVSNAFSTAAYRFGHSLVQHSFVRFDTDHRPLFNNVSIHDEFSNPVNLETAGSVDRLLLGLVNQPSQKRDEYMSEELTNHLFQTPRFPFGMDLAALNVQRGRDHGLPPYVYWREPCGLSPVKTFEDLDQVISPDAAKKFRLLYSSVEDVDLFSAGLAEKSVMGGLVGPTFACLIAQQFGNLRRGDRFWYENPAAENSFTPGQLQQIRRVSLAQVFCKTMDNIRSIQPFVFLMADASRNQRVTCEDETIGQIDLEFWAEKPPEVRSKSGESLEKLQRRADRFKATTQRSNTKRNDPNVKFNQGENSKFIPPRVKPVNANIHQHNRIVVKTPFRPSDNLTIVVHNNAVNSPVFVNDGIYDSSIGNRQTTTEYPRPPMYTTQRPINHNSENVGPGFIPFPIYGPEPVPKPIPTALPQSSHRFQGNPYVPHAFDDPSNPNPLNYGFKPELHPVKEVVYDSLSSSSPRPPLYTYYTNSLRPTTQTPNNYQNDEYQTNHRPPYQDDHRDKVKPIPRPPQHSPQYGSNDQSIWPEKPAYANNPRPQSHYQDHPHQGADKVDYEPWPSLSYQPRPTNRPASNWNYQNNQKMPSTGSNFDRDDVDTNRKAPNRNHYGTWSGELSYQEGTSDGTVVGSNSNAWSDASSYNEEKPIARPLQSDSDGWTTISASNSQKGPTKGPSQDPNTWATYTLAQKVPPGRPTNGPSPIQVNHWSEIPFYLQRPSDALQSDNSYSDNRPIKDPTVHPPSKGPSKPDVTHHNHRPGSSTPSSYQYQTPTEEQLYLRPVKIQTVTIVTETIDTVDRPSSLQYKAQEKAREPAEVPKPFVAAQSKNEYGEILGKPGQYYYEKNVLHRYPDRTPDQSEEINSTMKESLSAKDDNTRITEEHISFQSAFLDIEANAEVIRNDETKLITTPTIVVGSHVDKDYDLEGAFSENMESVESVAMPHAIDRTNNWLHPREDIRVSEASEVPLMKSDEISSAKELPKPMKLRTNGS